MKTTQFLVFVLLLSSSLFSQNSIYVSPLATGSGVSPTEPIGLQAALDMASSNGLADTLYLEGATFQGPFELDLVDGDGLDIAISGGWVSDFTFQDTEPYTTIIDGASSNRGLTISALDAGLELTVSMAYISFLNCSVIDASGAGIWVNGGSTEDASNIHLSLYRMYFVNNTTVTSGVGGAIYTTGSFDFYECTFDGNAASSGGAIISYRTPVSETVPSNIHRCIFVNNSNYGNQGSSLWHNCLDLTITDSQFYGMDSGLSSGNGSAVWGNNGSHLTVDRCKFENIRINYWASAIQSFDGSMDIKNSLFLNNQSGLNNGYAVIAFYHSNGPDREVIISNCTFDGNASQPGISFAGAIHNRGNGGDVIDVSNSIFINNGNTSIYSESGPAFISNCASDQAPLGFSIINPILTENPLLDAEYQLDPASPCIDAGNTSLIEEGAVDLGNGIRVLGDDVDLGCFEYNAAPSGIAISTDNINEDHAMDALVAELSALGQQGDEHDFILVPGDGTNDAHNDLFYTSGGALYLSSLSDYETLTSYNIYVKAIDTEDQEVEQAFVIQVNDVNEAPIVTMTIEDQTGTLDEALDFTIDPEVFFDEDNGDVLTFSASLLGGADLPAWLEFDANSLQFTGTPTETGTFVIEITAMDLGELEVSTTFNLVILPVGLYERENSLLMLSPNPAQDILRVELPSAGSYPYLIMDQTGRVVMNGALNASQSIISIQALSPGRYTFRLWNGREYSFGHFIKE